MLGALRTLVTGLFDRRFVLRSITSDHCWALANAMQTSTSLDARPVTAAICDDGDDGGSDAEEVCR